MSDGLCYSWATKNGRPGDVIVHGWVTNPLTQRRFQHAWIERRGRVLDNNLARFKASSMPKEKYYEVLRAEPVDRYRDYEAMVYVLRTGHHGPWSLEERGTPPKPPRSKRSRSVA